MSFNNSKSETKDQSTQAQQTNYNSTTNVHQNKTYQEGPWAAQAGHLSHIFGAANDLYNRTKGANQATQSLYRNTADTFGGMYDKATGYEADMQGRWNDLQGKQQEATDRFNQLTDNILGRGMGDFQQEAADFAGNNPYLDQAVSKSWDNANKLLDQQVGGAGGIDHAASMGGNMSSSRAGVAEGLATAEMADRGQQNELALRQSAYDQGLGQSNQLHQGRITLASLLEQNPADQAAILAGQQAAQAGYQGMQSNSLLEQIEAAAAAEQYAWNPLRNFYDIIGSRDWGSQGSSEFVSDQNIDGTSKTDTTYSGSSKTKGSSFGGSLSDLEPIFKAFNNL